ncbi:MAG: peptidase S41, partial [Bacteroidetes bacterium]|nr:peptidase S41 [Bacteroidota bacterium]
MRKPHQKNHFYLIQYTGLLLAALFCLTACSSSKKNFSATRAFPKEKLQEDYRLFRAILEESHPSLYWYTSKDSLDSYFDKGYSLIQDSMTESQFRTLLSYVIAKIDCGHTSVRYSKNYSHYIDTARLGQFPLGLKFWDDTVAIYSNLNRRDSVLTRGTVVKSIDGMPIGQVRDSLFQYMVTDGYSINHKYQTLSNLGNFGLLYQAVYGPRERFNIGYIDRQGVERSANIGLYEVKKDTLFRRFVATQEKTSKKMRKRNRLFSTRNLQVDTAGNTAYMTVNTFANGNHLKSFFRSSFSYLHKAQIKNLIIDVRTNGGGNVGLSTRLTQYLSDHKFKIADSLYAVRKMSHYEKYIENSFAEFFFMNFMTRKRADGKYHFGYFERHYFKPKGKNRYNGNVYILVGGNSFSATTLLVNAVKGQKNVTVVGEETGGGAYGNTAWFIPDVTLPNTRVRFRLPKFHMVMNRNYIKDGHGIIPDVVVKPSVDA